MSNAPNSNGQNDVRAGWTSATPAPPLDVEAGAGGNVGQESPDTRDGTLLSFGMPLEDRLAKRVTIQVFVLAVTIAAFSVIHFITTLMMGHFEISWENPTGAVIYRSNRLWADMASLIIELSIPMAGYLGALYHNRQLTCCFCSCNLFLVFAITWTFLTLFFRQQELAGNCYLEAEEQNRALCYMWLDDGVHKWVYIADAICSVCLSCCAAMASIRLFHKLSREPPNIESTPVIGEVVRLQENTPLTRVANQQSSIAPNGHEVALYSIDRAAAVTPPADGSPTPVRASVPRASLAATVRPPSVRIELAPQEPTEDEY